MRSAVGKVVTAVCDLVDVNDLVLSAVDAVMFMFALVAANDLTLNLATTVVGTLQKSLAICSAL